MSNVSSNRNGERHSLNRTPAPGDEVWPLYPKQFFSQFFDSTRRYSIPEIIHVTGMSHEEVLVLANDDSWRDYGENGNPIFGGSDILKTIQSRVIPYHLTKGRCDELFEELERCNASE